MAGSYILSNMPMQSTVFPPSHLPSGDPLRVSVGHLLSRAHALPCSTAARAFAGLVPPTSRFQLALDALLPLLNNSNEVCCILVDAGVIRSDNRCFGIAFTTHPGFLYSVFLICTPSDFYQPFQICLVLHFRERKR